MSLASLNPGRLDRLVTLRYPLNVRGSAGGAAALWVNASVKSWASWLPQSGREFVAAASRNAEITGALRIRYRSDVGPTWRIILDDVLYEIVAVLEIGRRSFQDLLLKQAAAHITTGVGVQVFEVELAAGDTSKAVTFPVAFDSVPAGIYCQLIIPADGYPFTTEAGSITADGFTVSLGAEVPASGYKLSVQAFITDPADSLVSQALVCQVLTVSLAEGATSVDVEYSSSFLSSPAGIRLTLVAPSGMDEEFTFTTCPLDSSRGVDGFTVNFAAAVPAVGYTLRVQSLA